MVFMTWIMLFVLVVCTSIKRTNFFDDFLGLTFLSLEMFFFWMATVKLDFAYSDLIVYYATYVQSISWNWSTFVQMHQFEFFYDIIVWIIAKIFKAFSVVLSRHDFVLIINYIKILIIYFGIRRIKSPYFSALVASIFLWYQYSNLFSYNLLRQGLALGFLVVVIISFSKTKNIFKYLIMLIFLCFLHKSMIYLGLLSGIGVLLIYKKVINRKWLYVGVVLGSVLYVTKSNGVLLSKLPINFVQLYQSSDVQSMAASIGSTTNDVRYLFFTLIFLCATYFILKSAPNNLLISVIHDYIFLISIIYLFMGFIPFSFRIVMSAWFLFPIMLFIYIDKKFRYSFVLYFLIVIFIVIEGWAAGPFIILGGY